MEITIYEKEKNELIGKIKVRKNLKQKTILAKVKDYIQEKYNCTIRTNMVTGKIDFANNTSELSYVLFGENLPFRQYYIIKSN